MKVAVLVVLILAAVQAFPIDNLPQSQIFPDSLSQITKEVDQLKGFFEIFTGFAAGFIQTAKEDFYAFPDCVYGFPCAYTVLADFVEYLREMDNFDIKKIFEKFYSLVIMGTIGCLQSCMIPYTYYMHFSPLLDGITSETIQQVLLNGLLYNILTIYFNGQDAVKAFMENDFYECGLNLGVIFWAVLIR